MHIKKMEEYKVDCELFEKNLIAETLLLEEWFAKDYFKYEAMKAGAEIEFLILDKHYQLTPDNLFFTKKIRIQELVQEAGRSQLEINVPVLPLKDDFLSKLHQSILTIWNKCCETAFNSQHHLALIGSIPQVDPAFFSPLYITPQNIFILMDEFVAKYRNGESLSIHLEGEKENLRLFPESLAIEGLICSLQLHLEVPNRQSTHYFNIIQILSAPLLALSSNSPYFAGKRLWSETRIGIFEQLYTFPLPLKKTVFFEPNYFKENLFPIFKNNFKNFPYLLPLASYKDPINNMFHVRCQNSCIFRWNRPILDFNQQHEPYLRIEHRVLSSGPTIIDMVANAAFFYGITFHYANHLPSLSSLIHQESSLKNFYEAARFGLEARLNWSHGKIKASTLLKDLLPLALKGLEELGINHLEARFYLDIIKTRLERNQNGSIWQEQYLAKHNNNFNSLLEQYVKNQYSETPVAEWSLD
ncbi:glutamate-cysteine ligase family protein [Legionella sp. PC997]|uniref:glutamate-cysteine ligase family protein n=1 Tax=Legionella sp. PC997 TaxID=2755562 RepID=UPI0015F8E5FD|nr:glutamate-cysteine ligase family protein [Legionella sp. PC997]QMT59833.1 Glutamate--cysteine ligase [Legionella sp. PC997]